MANKHINRTLNVFFLLLCGFLFSCTPDPKPAAAIDEVRMEAGNEINEFVIFARFTGETGKVVRPEGSLEIGLYQNGQEFFRETMQVTPKDFENFNTSIYQYKSKTYSVQSFKFQPAMNRFNWYDYSVKATFQQGDKPVLEWSGLYPVSRRKK